MPVRSTAAAEMHQMTDCSAEAALESLTRQMQRLPAFLRQSLTLTAAARWADMKSWRSGSN